MFEIPDDDENFWNDIPLEDNIPSKSGKENRPQLRVPDTTCSGNPAKRLCMKSTDFVRDGTLPVQVDHSSPQFRSTNNINWSEQREDSRIYTESAFNIPFPTTTATSSLRTVTTSKSVRGNIVTTSLVTSAEGSYAKSDEGNPCTDIFTKTGSSRVTLSTINSLDAESTTKGYHGNGVVNASSKSVDAKTDGINAEKSANITACSSIVSAGSHMKTSDSEGRSIEADRNNIHLRSSESAKMMTDQNKQKESSGVNTDENRSRLIGSSVRDHVTPKRKRKFPGPAGILPKLGPGRSLDMLSPATLNTQPKVTMDSPQDNSVILCSQSTDDIFGDSPWQTLLRNIGDDGQKLLKKFSISSTLLKAGKRQLIQGKAALIFGVIDTIESHGSEASVTIRDKSGRMQGTIHRDLFKEHETDLQIGTVLVLKQVSIISLSNRNHYLNITPNNVVVLYCGGQSSLRTLKFHGSEDSLQSVLSTLEKKAAAQRNNLNNSGTMTPSLPGSPRHSVTGSGTGTPQLFVPSQGTPLMNQQLFSPRTPVTGHPGLRAPIMGQPGGIRSPIMGQPGGLRAPITGQPGGLRSPITCQPGGLRAPVPAAVRDVSVIERNIVPTYQRFGNSTPNVTFRPGMNTPAVNSSISSQLTTDSSHLSSQNINFKVVPVQTNANFARLNPPVSKSLDNSSPVAQNCSGFLSSCRNVRHMNVSDIHHSNQKQPELNTPNTGGNSKWKFKSPPGRNASRLSTSSDLSALAGNSGNSKVGHLNGMNASISSSIGHISLPKNGRVIGNAVQTSNGDVSSSKNLGDACRSWQVNNQIFDQKTDTGNRTNNTLNTGSTTAWSFKPLTANNAVTWTERQTVLPSKFVTQVAEENLWEDDLSDDLLSQLSEDLT